MVDDIKWMNKKEKWLGLKSIGVARNTIERDNKKTVKIDITKHLKRMALRILEY